MLVEQQLYLFDARLGLPIWSADRRRPATLAEVAANDALLRAYDLPQQAYPVTVAALEKPIVWIEPVVHRVNQTIAYRIREGGTPPPGTVERGNGTCIATGAPIFIVLPIVAFFYCLGALYDDRRDRSILFWKSLPISDTTTVLSKLLTALVLAPAITIAIASAAASMVGYPALSRAFRSL